MEVDNYYVLKDSVEFGIWIWLVFLPKGFFKKYMELKMFLCFLIVCTKSGAEVGKFWILWIRQVTLTDVLLFSLL